MFEAIASMTIASGTVAKISRMAGIAMLCSPLWPASPGFAQDAPHEGDTVTSLAHAMAPGWSVLMRADGDLNKDGLADIAAAIESGSPGGESNSCAGGDDYSVAPVRQLMVLLHQPGGGYKIAVKDHKLPLRRDQGGVFGDPLQNIEIDRGTLLVDHYGGSRERWGHVARFRLQQKEWQMIGYTRSVYDTATGVLSIYDYNPLTAKVKLTVERNDDGDDAPKSPICVQCRRNEKCPDSGGCYAGQKPVSPGVTWFRIEEKPLVSMRNFRCWWENTGLFTHTGFAAE